jgi:hypothetical protein
MAVIKIVQWYLCTMALNFILFLGATKVVILTLRFEYIDKQPDMTQIIQLLLAEQRQQILVLLDLIHLMRVFMELLAKMVLILQLLTLILALLKRWVEYSFLLINQLLKFRIVLVTIRQQLNGFKAV